MRLDGGGTFRRKKSRRSEREREREKKTLAKEKLAIITRVIVHMIKPVVRI